MSESIRGVLPEGLLIVVATGVYIAGAFARGWRGWRWVAAGALVAAALVMGMAGTGGTPVPPGAGGVAGASLVQKPPLASPSKGGEAVMVRGDVLAVSAKLVFLLAGLLFVGLGWAEASGPRESEYYASLLLVVAGTMLVSGANELILVFLALELISMPTYVLLYLRRHDAAGQEAAAKYFFLSVLSSALLLYGFSFLYGLGGSTRLDRLAEVLGQFHAKGGVASGIGLIALVMIFAGLGFKITAVPFHFYAPDVYQGTTPLVAGLLAFAPKAAGFVALLRVTVAGMEGYEDAGSFLAMILAIITMTGGNVLALLQDNLRRLLAYSSIAHAGYLLIGVAVGFQDRPAGTASGAAVFGGNQAVLVYLVAYGLMTIGAFGVLVYLSRERRPVEHVDDLAGLGYTHPVMAAAMAVFLFSLAGLPPLAGFWGKLAVFGAALSASGEDRRFAYLAVIGVINAAMAAYYYLRIVATMYLRQPLAVLKPGGGSAARGAVLACALLTVAVGLAPRWLFTQARSAAGDLQQAASTAVTAAERSRLGTDPLKRELGR